MTTGAPGNQPGGSGWAAYALAAFGVATAGAWKISSQSFLPTELVPALVYAGPAPAADVAPLTGSTHVAAHPAGNDDTATVIVCVFAAGL